MPKVLAYVPLHYGKEYLRESLLSIEPFVEKIIILYTEKPSYGFGTTVQCPETEGELKEIALSVSDKVEWIKISPGNEGEHRGYIYRLSEGYDGILSIDADEIFDQDDLPVAIDLADKSGKRYIGFGGYINFWKSFNYACYDGFTPIRYINLKNTEGQYVVPCKVYHFSTAQSIETMKYKLLIHGHKNEIRPGWFEEVYQKWTPGAKIPLGLHLVSYNLWEATPYNKELLPLSLRRHPNYNKDVIE